MTSATRIARASLTVIPSVGTKDMIDETSVSSHPSAIVLLCLLGAFWRGIDASDASEASDASDVSDVSDVSDFSDVSDVEV